MHQFTGMWLNPNSRGSRLRIWQPWGCKSLHAHHFAHVVQRRDGALKTRTVSVQIRPWAPTACSPRQRRSAQDGKVAGASPVTRTNFGMSTGQARRASVLTSACLRASGALQFATANSSIWGIHLARLGKSNPRQSGLCRRPPARVAQREPAALYPASH